MSVAVRLLKGDDPLLVGEAVRAAVDELLDGDDRSLAVEELDEDSYRVGDDFDISRLVDAAQTAPFLTNRRVVIGRHVGRFSKADAIAPLLRWFDAPLDTTALVLVWERGVQPRQDRLSAPPKKLLEAIAALGGTVVDCAAPSGRQGDQWLDQRLSASSLRLDRGAIAEIHRRFGEDRTRVVSLLEVLESTYGPGETLTLDQVEPFLGEGGSIPPWELTDAIDDGDIAGSIDRLRRQLSAGDRHPLQVMASLHGRYERMLRLDGAEVRDEKAAAALLGMKGSTFPAKKLLAQTRKLGSERIGRAIGHLADADLALRGASSWPEALTMEVLVARLAALHRR